MKTFGRLPDDPFYERINPYLKVWLYESWLHDRELEIEALRSQAILIGSFFNPEAAQKMIKAENPDFSTTDIEETSKQLHEQILEEEKDKTRDKKRKKRRVVE